MRTRTQGETGLQRVTDNTLYYYYRGELQSTSNHDSLYYGSSKTTVDEIHKNYPKEGGPLSIREISYNYDAPKVRSGYAAYSGYIYDYHRVISGFSVSLPEDNLEETTSLGPAAWSKFRPAKPKVSLGQFIAELRDFPKLFKFRLSKFRDLGSDYLNAQFGWKPFLSDIRSWIQSMYKLDKDLYRLQKQNGKWIRRGGTLSLLESVEEIPSTTIIFGPTNGLDSIVKKGTATTYSKSWFKGSFRYYIPGLSDGKWGEFRSIQKLWGLEVTPELVYNLIPYSWLLDWVSNVGDVISNFTSITFDNTAAKYAYVMQNKRYEIATTVNFRSKLWEPGMSEYTYRNHQSHLNVRAETKCRAAASPYGFAMDWDSFSAYQLSILAALGISRV